MEEPPLPIAEKEEGMTGEPPSPSRRSTERKRMAILTRAEELKKKDETATRELEHYCQASLINNNQLEHLVI